MKVMVIPEDPTLDRHILLPIVERIFKDLGRRATIHPLEDPHLKGADQALDEKILRDIIADNPMYDLFLLIVDQDCDRFGHALRAKAREGEHPGRLITCLARHEVEVWMLALHRQDLAIGWSEVRDHCDPKEHFAEPFLMAKGWHTETGKGRKRAMRGLGGQWAGLCNVCPEIADLKTRIDDWISARR